MKDRVDALGVELGYLVDACVALEKLRVAPATRREFVNHVARALTIVGRVDTSNPRSASFKLFAALLYSKPHALAFVQARARRALIVFPTENVEVEIVVDEATRLLGPRVVEKRRVIEEKIFLDSVPVTTKYLVLPEGAIEKNHVYSVAFPRHGVVLRLYPAAGNPMPISVAVLLKL